MGLQNANAADQFEAIHAGHSIIGDHDIEFGAFKKLEAFHAILGAGDAVALLLEEVAADDEAVAVVVDEEDVGGWGVVSSHWRTVGG